MATGKKPGKSVAKQPQPVALTAESLAGVEAFGGLGVADRGRIASLCQGRRYDAGQRILSQEDEARDVHFIVSGRIRVTIYSVNGREITFRDQGAGEMFGELGAIDGAPRSAHVVALEDSLLACMPRERFWEVLRGYPRVAEFTFVRLVKLVRLLSERVFEFSSLAVRNRIHAELLRLARENMHDDNVAIIAPAPTHADIASRISTHREAVTREYQLLSEAGVIEPGRGRVVIRDVARLESMVREVTGR
ncbi:MAG: cyclic nucleotide-binding domain-containing protein [Gammaproteobacteria bacterium]|nr:cyclic nucleotide-binding domain-containing protein [Gammaproteobacteria bacterium]NIM73579.1 cyclic nucleotide-binding domain-containing protein [Gammaproteobacteria bacterium]NIO25388.1 cyclic nucleotide-binding domain-containing protein [Gammaproteobacteria bacterium]NIP64914.1 cyclic nucleotide-binding domain-containing protein [Gammaproteobacteria bacterium]NIQ28055.1 cyclic nucleotide-binding domain-containing protein [Gammaproteobacteria bacterium]